MTDTPAPSMGLVLDCADPQRLADFWAPALGYVSLGMAGSYAVLLPDGRPGPKLLLQQVPEPKRTKNRMHLDIEAPDIEGEAARLEGLGAQRVQEEHVHEHGTTWILMTDPEGNEFCVCDGGTGVDQTPPASGATPAVAAQVPDEGVVPRTWTVGGARP